MPHDASAALAMPGMANFSLRYGSDADAVKPKRSIAVLAVVAGLHLAIFASLASLRVITVPIPELVTMVNIVMPSPPVHKEIPVTPPKPLPTSAKVAPQPLPALNQTVETPPLAKSEIAPIVANETVKPTASAAAAPAVAVAPAPAPAPAPVVQSAPRFDADYLDNPAPAYPPLSRRGNEEGKVVLRVFVEANGSASQLEVRTSSGYERLDKAALAAVARWKFVPARAGNDVIGAWVLVPIVFSLKS